MLGELDKEAMVEVSAIRTTGCCVSQRMTTLSSILPTVENWPAVHVPFTGRETLPWFSFNLRSRCNQPLTNLEVVLLIYLSRAKVAG